jgi:hypothetical protein
MTVRQWITCWTGCGRKRSWPDMRYYPSIYLWWLKKKLWNTSV